MSSDVARRSTRITVTDGSTLAISRLIWCLTGLAWAIRSLLEFSQPGYSNPVTVLDWGAVWSYSIAWLMFVPSVLLLGRLASSRKVMVVATIFALGAVMAGSANAIEDGFGVRAFGAVYLVGFLIAWLSLLPLAVVLWRARCPRLAGLVVALFVGVSLFTLGAGLIILVALGALAYAPEWFGPAQPAAAGVASGSSHEPSNGASASPYDGNT
jgi:hypothetical protein